MINGYGMGQMRREGERGGEARFTTHLTHLARWRSTHLDRYGPRYSWDECVRGRRGQVNTEPGKEEEIREIHTQIFDGERNGDRYEINKNK